MIRTLRYRLFIFIFLCILPLFLHTQNTAKNPFFVPADTLDKTRFWTCLGIGSAIYGSTAVALYHAWYKEYELTGFHTFNDAAEWLQMDKMGHLFTAYTESRIAGKGAKWTGMSDKSARWVGVGVGLLLQSTIEVMDGFSAKWGFSWSDMSYNVLGAGLYMGQDLLWAEQRIIFKVSNTSPDYTSTQIPSMNGGGLSSPAQRAKELFGRSYAETFLKDYNGMTVWASINPTSFFSNKNSSRNWPQWLNVAVGYSGENLYGGFENSWMDDNGNTFSLSSHEFPRYRQFFLSFDIDMNRIPTRSPVLKTFFTIISWIKIPAPSLEINTQGGVKLHPFFW